MTAVRQRPILWDLYEEHLDEAAFLWGEWETALDAAVYTLADVAAGPEERLLAHLDGLVLGGKPVAEKLLLPALGGDDLEKVRPAAWALLGAEDADHFDPVLEALATSEPPKAWAIVRALGLARHPATVSRLTPLWTHGSPQLRALILEIVSLHDLTWAAARVPELVRPGDPQLLAAAIRLLRRVPTRDPALIWYVDEGLKNPDAIVRQEALATGFVLGSGKVWAACREEIDKNRAGRLVFGLLALAPKPPERDLVRAGLRADWSARHALWALGFAADVAAADEIVGLMKNPELAPLAGEALTAITGFSIAGRYRAAGVTKGPAEAEVGDDDPPPVVRPEDHLPAPAMKPVTEWWRKNCKQFTAGQRYVLGVPRTPAALQAALSTLPTWRREVLALEIASTNRTPVAGDLRGWARRT